MLVEGLRGTVAPIGPPPLAGGTGSPAKSALGAHGGTEGESSPQWHGPPPPLGRTSGSPKLVGSRRSKG